MNSRRDRKGAGQGVFAIAMATAAVMAFTAYLHTGSASRLDGEMGLCFTSPNNWNLDPALSCGLNYLLLTAAGVGMIFLNKRYYYIQRADQLQPALFLLLAAAFPWLDRVLCSSTILVAVNLACTAVLFGCYEKRNTTQQIFLTASLLSLGSTVQYACVFYMPLYIAGGIVAKSFSLKEIPAFLLGVAAPYWCLLGTGLASITDLQLPTMSNIFTGFAPTAEVISMAVACGVAAVVWLVLAFNNSLQLLKEHIYVRRFNTVVNILGAGSILLMLCDFTNIMAYISTFMFCLSVQIAQSVTSSRQAGGRGALTAVWLIAVGFFISITVTF